MTVPRQERPCGAERVDGPSASRAEPRRRIVADRTPGGLADVLPQSARYPPRAGRCPVEAREAPWVGNGTHPPGSRPKPAANAAASLRDARWPEAREPLLARVAEAGRGDTPGFPRFGDRRPDAAPAGRGHRRGSAGSEGKRATKDPSAGGRHASSSGALPQGCAFRSGVVRVLALLSVAALAWLLLGGGPAAAQQVTLDLGGQGSLATRSIQLIVLVTVLSLVPGLAVMVTCFPFVVTVLSILRQALGLQQAPPNMMIVSLALFLTWFIMEPTFTEAWTAGVQPFLDGRLPLDQAFLAALRPFRLFMAGRVAGDTFDQLAALRPTLDPGTAPLDAPLSVLVPSFLLSEIERAFQIGFLIYLPFLVIDLVVAAVLMSMGMMMVPPAIVSLPFKLAFFVVADGWTLIAESVVRSYL